MTTKTSKEFTRLESWLSMLLSTYKTYPSTGLAKTISYYLTTVLRHDDINFCGDKRCDYLAMQRYWHWQATKKIN
jgi:hypothetical protein